MGRPPGAKNKKPAGQTRVLGGDAPPKAKGAPAAGGIGHNSGDLNDEEQHALHLRHVTEFERSEKALETAKANHRNVGKRIKAEGGSMEMVKLTIRLRTPEGEAAAKEELNAKARIMRWHGLPIGSQDDLFTAQEKSQYERGYESGKMAGMLGVPLRTDWSPGTEGYRGFTEGYHHGQAVNLSAIKKTGSAKTESAPATTHVRRPAANEAPKPDEFDERNDGGTPAAEENPVAEKPSETPPASENTEPAVEEVQEVVDPPADNVGVEIEKSDSAEEHTPWPDEAQIADRKGE